MIYSMYYGWLYFTCKGLTSPCEVGSLQTTSLGLEGKGPSDSTVTYRSSPILPRAPGLPSTFQLYEPRAEEGPWPVGEEDASAQEAVWSLASCLLYSVYQFFVNFGASKLNCKKHRRWHP